jgi:hypothetical protein
MTFGRGFRRVLAAAPDRDLDSGPRAVGQLASVPKNAFKYTVGFLLTSFGIFWTGEGVGIDWQGATRRGRR